MIVTNVIIIVIITLYQSLLERDIFFGQIYDYKVQDGGDSNIDLVCLKYRAFLQKEVQTPPRFPHSLTIVTNRAANIQIWAKFRQFGQLHQINHNGQHIAVKSFR